MNAFARAALFVFVALGVSACGHSHSSSAGASSPSHSSGSSSSSHSAGAGESYGSHSSGGSGSSHAGGHVANNTSYLEPRPAAYIPAPAHHDAAPPKSPGDGGDDTRSQIVGAIAAAVLQGIGELTSSPDPSPGDVPPSHEETPCEAALREFTQMHPDGMTKLPPQLRCGPKGEWGTEKH